MIDRTALLLTGGSGFVGRALLSRLGAVDEISVRVASRAHTALDTIDSVVVGDLSMSTDWSSALEGINIVVHAAARAHIMQDNVADPLSEFRKVNVAGTLKLAEQAAAAGVTRFVFISSVKVNGESTAIGRFFVHDDPPNPEDAYGISKAEAEAGLKKIAQQTGMEVVIIRPPLVYGPGVKANFAAMLNLAQKNLPLPLGAIHNKRSLVALDNLVDLIVTCIDHPKAANQTFLVSDDQDVSTTQLLQMMTRAAGKKPRLLPVPVSWLKLAAKISGKQAEIDRLCGNLQVDISHTKETLAWKPPVSVEEGIARCFTAKG